MSSEALQVSIFHFQVKHAKWCPRSNHLQSLSDGFRHCSKTSSFNLFHLPFSVLEHYAVSAKQNHNNSMKIHGDT